jgi:nicotinate-nucleotide--dimethylbenzimidazole phosphoribosyltransferase
MVKPLIVSSLDQVRDLVRDLPGPDEAAAAAAREREANLTKPAGSLGRLESLAEWIATWQGRHPPEMKHPHAAVFVGNHGIARLGVSAYPMEVTAQMHQNYLHGGAGFNAMCRAMGVSYDIYDIDLDRPTEDFTQAPAMSEADLVAALNVGMSAVKPGMSVFCPGEMGIANTASAAAVLAALFKGTAEEWTGAGSGVTGVHLARKVEVVRQGLARHTADDPDPLEILRRLGGRELAAMTGAILAGRMLRVPVLVDGFLCSASAAVLECMAPGALAHCRFSHASLEAGHALLMQKLSGDPILHMDMRLGEATGAILAVGILRSAVACHTELLTFEEARVSRNRPL